MKYFLVGSFPAAAFHGCKYPAEQLQGEKAKCLFYITVLLLYLQFKLLIVSEKVTLG